MNFDLNQIQDNHPLLVEICKHLKKNYESFVDFSKNTFESVEEWKSFCESKWMNKPIYDYFPLEITDQNICNMVQDDGIHQTAKCIVIKCFQYYNSHNICKLLQKNCVWENLQSIDLSQSSIEINNNIISCLYQSLFCFWMCFFTKKKNI